jgi:hypothetical protein
MDVDQSLRARRLAAQRLTPATACKSAEEAALAVIGVQAQDLRAAALALRSRVPGLTRSTISPAHVDSPRHRAPDRDIRSPVAARAIRQAKCPRVRSAALSAVASPKRSTQCAGTSSSSAQSSPATALRCCARSLSAATRRFSRVRSTHSFRGFQRRASSSPTRSACCTSRPAPGGRPRRGACDPWRPLPRRLWPVQRIRPREVVLAAHHTGAAGARTRRAAERH